ncbi:MAG TPA: aspartate/glutamate racemase family protein [Sphingobacteriaceae bacterium]|nr:aspartate/glutamate racemase family protein [Sphingobacteriaceae bacterium]
MMLKSKFLPMGVLAVGLCVGACTGGDQQDAAQAAFSPIEEAILNDPDSFYYLDLADYPSQDATLPIGVFDSGTGGLTVLDALVRFDQHQNSDWSAGGDGVPDFASERFIYLADQANMPYGNYYATDKSDLLVEHVIKDVQFLLGNKYYTEAEAEEFRADKEQIKAIVIACNTATAYAVDAVRDFVAKSGLDLPVIGVIDAGAKGVLEKFDLDESGTIGVFATVGTVASQGYERTINLMKESLGYTGRIQIVNQGGHGVAEAVDEEADFLSRVATQPRDNYRGPSLEHPDFKIDRTLMDVYNFDFDHNQMLCDTQNMDDCQILQINSPENYVRYHLVSMMEKVRNTPDAEPLKAIVLGCTHYPYLTQEIQEVLSELYDYQLDGEYLYRPFLVEHVHIIDPSENVAVELYQYLAENDLRNPSGDMKDSEFFISVPNVQNSGVQLDEAGRFTYDYKYGRNAGEIQEYVRVVPFSRDNIPAETIERLSSTIPATFELIWNFSAYNEKNAGLSPELRIGKAE